MIPSDPVMLLSYVNTRLRDYDRGLDELCAQIEMTPDELKEKLAAIDYAYDPQQNQFV